ncbi:TIGR03571 family LLM class oxidoreductase [Flavobacterium geliluteum]|uniref:TIGR03571 family LLM class oxidoreductase n=1 Tax=Flavobacterium geliluteum TaxID=2816120 RepID=A0A940X7Y1_9FLAO|nr:TIGR03571 family LLM class oxidoreductase [Flavobacterium geliluteum]MBP4137042.1 TIGR03571 family LLM class oxidoreductase [Flavobacterium geliluteum]
MKTICKIHNPGKMTIGLEFPLDNDWSLEGERKRKTEGRPFGIPDIKMHTELIKLAEELGFSALWMREVPVYDPNFGDGAQIFDTLAYLGYIAGITKSIVIGTAAVVLPLHDPLQLAKAVATIENLSESRYLFGVGLGDRPVEFPLFNFDFETRTARFVLNHNIIKEAWKNNSELNQYYEGLSNTIQIYPKPQKEIPWILAGRAQQSLNWIAQNMQGWFNYPRDLEDTRNLVIDWKNALYDNNQATKPYITAYHLNLLKNPNAPLIPHRFGGSVGVNSLVTLLKQYEEAGVNHMALHLRKSETPLKEALTLIAEKVLPHFKIEETQKETLYVH